MGGGVGDWRRPGLQGLQPTVRRAVGRQGSQAKVGHNQICTVERVLCKVNTTAKRMGRQPVLGWEQESRARQWQLDSWWGDRDRAPELT